MNRMLFKIWIVENCNGYFTNVRISSVWLHEILDQLEAHAAAAGVK